jgi:hypothetical protein
VTRIAFAVCLLAALFSTTIRLPASVCPVASAPAGEACQMGCCANKCCCARSVKSEPAPVPAAKQTEAKVELIGDIAISAHFIMAPIAIEPAQFGRTPSNVVISKTRPALLCTFLI